MNNYYLVDNSLLCTHRTKFITDTCKDKTTALLAFVFPLNGPIVEDSPVNEIPSLK
ncbi:hypothetical protein [Geomicrobium sp. JCM 19038]|uniref:hypothetical protein n=1 Tax=Geomicrobium sp. JCM 19038 TaxID=1460635 RepID=UPI00045F2CEB|nr:hypothetical protein [Geomicrobium sp. JCM 19038]GAK07972.1 hypothetical protein JCM19038_1731 [Geomicrobium sp. JCM 19038]